VDPDNAARRASSLHLTPGRPVHFTADASDLPSVAGPIVLPPPERPLVAVVKT